MLKKINDIFRHKGIFDFSHLQFDSVRAQTDGSDIEGTKKLEQWRWRPLNFFRGTQSIAIFFKDTQGIPPWINTVIMGSMNHCIHRTEHPKIPYKPIAVVFGLLPILYIRLFALNWSAELMPIQLPQKQIR